MKKFAYLFIILFNCPVIIYAQGYIESTTESMEEFDSYSKEGFGFAEEIPSNRSLKKFVPPIGNQRNTGSCVAWATTYYNLSIIYNRTFNITSFNDKYAHSFDPWTTYTLVNRFANESVDCSNGLSFADAFKMLAVFGGKKLFLPPHDISCNEDISGDALEVMARYSNPYEIEKIDVEYAYDIDPYNNPLKNHVVNKIKIEIGKYGFPVVAGFKNFGNTLAEVNSIGNWFPSYTPNSGAHAMTIVGYDDYNNGGSFQVVNSWGYEWGDGGYAWISYADFKKFCSEVYFTWLKDNIKEEMDQISNLTGYTRTYVNDNGLIYEGELYENTYSGYGIVSFPNDDSHYAGWFENGKMNGYFRMIDDDGLYQVEMDMGTPVDYTKLGFAESKENTKELENTNEYIKMMFPSIRFNNFNDDLDRIKDIKIE